MKEKFVYVISLQRRQDPRRNEDSQDIAQAKALVIF